MAYYTQGLISQRRGNASYFYHYDGLGSTKALSDTNQNVQASYKYDAWGNILQTSGTITNPYLYVGELGYYADGDSGMYLLTQRWYNPVIGRFVVRDPLKLERHLYRFVRNDPINIIDLEGLRGCLPPWSKECWIYWFLHPETWRETFRDPRSWAYWRCIFSKIVPEIVDKELVDFLEDLLTRENPLSNKVCVSFAKIFKFRCYNLLVHGKCSKFLVPRIRECIKISFETVTIISLVWFDIELISSIEECSKFLE